MGFVKPSESVVDMHMHGHPLHMHEPIIIPYPYSVQQHAFSEAAASTRDCNRTHL